MSDRNKFGFDIDPETKEAVTELGDMLFRDPDDEESTGVSAERLHDELFKMADVGGPALADFLEKLDEKLKETKSIVFKNGFMKHTFPMKNLDKSPTHAQK